MDFPEITLRIPGAWAHPQELIDAIPKGFQLLPDAVVSPEGVRYGMDMLPPDEMLGPMFAEQARTPLSTDEQKTLDNFQVNICLTGPGGSMKNALNMLEAASAFVTAGGAGVFCDNSGVMHGGQHWIKLAQDGSADALTFAYVGIFRGAQQVRTVGMGIMGCPDILMTRADADIDQQLIIELMRYLCLTDTPIEDGHLLGDENKALFKAFQMPIEPDEFPPAMRNPLGRLKLVNMKDAAEMN